MKGEQYLRRQEQYALVSREGASWADARIAMKALPNGLPIARYGISVGKRVGGAVVRNHVKRLLREILRVMLLKPGMDIVFIARAPSATAKFAVLKRSVEALLCRAHLLKENETACLGAD